MRGGCREVPAGCGMRRMSKIRLEPFTVVELEDRHVLIIDRHRLLVAGESVTHATSEAQPPQRGDRCYGVPKIFEARLALIVRQIGARFEQDDVDDHR